MIDLIVEWGRPPSVQVALKQATIAHQLGARWSKWQIFDPARLASADALRYWDEKLGGSDSQRENFEAAGSLTDEEWAEVAARCFELGVGFLASPFDLEAVELLERLGVEAYKIASGEITHRPMLERIARTSKPVFLSTGAASEREIDRALRWLRKCPTTVMACDLVYPCPLESSGLAQSIPRLARHRLDQGTVGVGFSDHTESIVTGAVAVTAGATTLERHVTLDPGGPSPDDKFALSVQDAQEYLRLANEAATLIAEPEGDPEAAARVGARRSAYAARDLDAGTQLVESDVAWLRPCPVGAFDPSRKLAGRTLLVAVGAGESIGRDAVA